MKKSLIKRICKRSVAFLLVMIIVTVTSFGTLAGCKKTTETGKAENSGSITRGQWVTLLGQTFQMNTYENTTPYYTDVDSDDEIFPYVQACYEWGILSQGTNEFKPDSTATKGFVVSTAVLATGIDYTGYSDNANEAILKCASESGIYSGDTSGNALTSGVSTEDVSIVLENAKKAYLVDTQEVRENIEYVESVIDGKSEKMTVSTDGNSCNVTSEFGEKLEIGSVFIQPPTTEYPAGKAVKVTSIIKNTDGTYNVNTSQPTFDEVAKNVDIHQVVDTKNVGFLPSEGVALVDNIGADAGKNAEYMNNTAMVNVASSLKHIEREEENIEKTDVKTVSAEKLTLSISIENGKIDKNSFAVGLEGITVNDITVSKGTIASAFQLEVSSPDIDDDSKFSSFISNEELKQTVSKVNEDIEKKESELNEAIQEATKKNETPEKLKETLKEGNTGEKEVESGKTEDNDGKKKAYKGGWKIEGTLEINPEFTIDCKTFPTVEFSVASTCTVSKKVTVKGELPVLDIPLGTFIVPVGTTGVDLQFIIKLYADVNGEISFGLEGVSESKVEYKGGKFKTTDSNSFGVTLEAKVTLEAGVKMPIIVRVVGVPIVDVTLKLYALAEFQSKGSVVRKDTVETKELDEPGKVNVKYTRDYYWQIDSTIDVYVPLFSIVVGDADNTLISKLGIKVTFDILTKELVENGFGWHFQPLKKTFKVPMYSVPYEYVYEYDPDRYAEKYYDFGAYLIELDVGQSKTLEKGTLPEDVKDKTVTYSSSNTSVAVVGPDGTITGLSEGTAQIKIMAGDKVLGYTQIIVNDPRLDNNAQNNHQNAPVE